MRRLALTLILLLCTAGCAGLGGSTRERPEWVTAPEAAEQASKFISGVGMAAAGGSSEAQRARAEQEARGELARAVGDYVLHVLSTFLKTHGNFADAGSATAKEFLTVVSAEVPNALLRQKLQSDGWEDASTGTAYVLYRIPISMVNDKINEKVSFALRNVNPFARGQEKDAADALRQFLNARLKERVALAARRQKPDEGAAPAMATPAWLAFGRHDDYPHARFLTTIGLGEDGETAAECARSQIAKQLEAQLVGRLLGYAGSEAGGDMIANFKSLRAAHVRMPGEEVLAAKVGETWYDHVTDTHYAFGVLDREVAGSLCGRRARVAFGEGDELLKSASNHHKAENYETALREYAQALARVQEAAVLQLTALVADPGRTDEFAALAKDVASLSQITARMGELLGAFSLEAQSGDGQWTPPGVRLHGPLVVKAVAGREARALADVPVRFRFVKGDGALQQLVKTGAGGTASCRVDRVDRAEEAVGSIEASIALDDLAPKGDFSGVKGPVVLFKYVLRTKPNTSIALYVDERTIEDKAVADHIVREAVRAALTEAKFTVVPSEQLPARVATLRGDAAEKDVLEAFAELDRTLAGKGFLLIVVGEVHCQLLETTKTSFGDLHYVKARVVLRAIDGTLPERPTVLAVTASRPEARTDNPEEAARGARTKAAKLAAQKLVSALKERFGAR